MPPPGRPFIPKSTSAFYADRFRTPQIIHVKGAGSGSGQVTGGGTTEINVTLSATGVVAGTYGDATHIPQITVEADGRITAISNVASGNGNVLFNQTGWAMINQAHQIMTA